MRPLFAIALALIANTAFAQSAFDKLYSSIRTDPSFKVRLQAIRVLVKQVKSGKGADDRVFAVLGEAAQKDEEHLVRGLACYALGEIGDARGKAPLELALKDSHAFVRAQAGDALKLVAKAAAPPTPASNVARNVLAFSIDDSPGIDAPIEVFDALKKYLGEEVRSQSSGRFQVVETAGQDAGYRFSGSIAQLSVEPDGNGANRVTVVVRIAITTVPENHLRHVMTAKASAASRGTGAAIAGLRNKVLQAAVVRAVKDSLGALQVE